MKSTGTPKSNDRHYKAILFLAIAFAMISSALKDLSQLRSATAEIVDVIAQLSDAVAPSANAETIGSAPSCLAGALVQKSDDFSWNGIVAQGGTIEIKNINGSITADPSNTNEVQVTATKRSRRSDASTVQIKVVPHAGGVTICALYPYEDGSYGTCEPGNSHNGRNGRGRNNDVNVDFTVRVPAAVSFIGNTVNGGIIASSLTGNVQTRTVNGSIKISTTGYAEASTVNGGIEAKLGNASWPDQIAFSTVNGEVGIDLPPGLNTEVEAQTLHGSINSEFPLESTNLKDSKHLKGRIGSGGRQILLKTLNGSITLRRAS